MAERIGDALLTLRVDDRGFNSGLDKAEARTKRFGRTLSETEQRVDRFGRSMVSAAGKMARFTAIPTVGIGLFAKDLIQANIQLESLKNTFGAISDSPKQAAQSLGFVRAEAELLGLELPKAATEFASLAAAAKGTALEGAATRDIFSAVAEASTVLGLSGEKTAGALNAIQQMISKGKVAAEELRGQLGERLPGAFQLAAKAMGKTTAELDAMLVAGELTANDLLPKLAKELRDRFGPAVEKAAQSLQAQINRLKTAIFELQIALGETGLIDVFKDVVVALKDAAKFMAALPVETRQVAIGLAALVVGIAPVTAAIGFLAIGVVAALPLIGALAIAVAGVALAFAPWGVEMKKAEDGTVQFGFSFSTMAERLISWTGAILDAFTWIRKGLIDMRILAIKANITFRELTGIGAEGLGDLRRTVMDLELTKMLLETGPTGQERVQAWVDMVKGGIASVMGSIGGALTPEAATGDTGGAEGGGTPATGPLIAPLWEMFLGTPNDWQGAFDAIKAVFIPNLKDLAEIRKIEEELAAKDIEALWARTEQAKVDLAAQAVNGIIGLMNAMGRENKALAIAGIALGKALAIAQVIQQTAVGAQAALAWGVATGNPAAGAALAGTIKALGAANIGIIAATGLVEISNLGSSGSERSSVGRATATTPQATQSSFRDDEPMRQQDVTVRIESRRNLFTRDEILEIMEAINEASGDGARANVVFT